MIKNFMTYIYPYFKKVPKNIEVLDPLNHPKHKLMGKSELIWASSDWVCFGQHYIENHVRKCVDNSVYSMTYSTFWRYVREGKIKVLKSPCLKKFDKEIQEMLK